MLELTALSFAYQNFINVTRQVFFYFRIEEARILEDRGKYKQTEFCNMRTLLFPLDEQVFSVWIMLNVD